MSQNGIAHFETYSFAPIYHKSTTLNPPGKEPAFNRGDDLHADTPTDSDSCTFSYWHIVEVQKLRY